MTQNLRICMASLLLLLPFFLGCGFMNDYRYKKPAKERVEKMFTTLWKGESKELISWFKLNELTESRLREVTGYPGSAKAEGTPKPTVSDIFIVDKGGDLVQIFFLCLNHKKRKFILVSVPYDNPAAEFGIKDVIDGQDRSTAEKKLEKYLSNKGHDLYKKL